MSSATQNVITVFTVAETADSYPEQDELISRHHTLYLF